MKTKPAHKPTPETRELVQRHSMVGARQDDIARIIGIDAKTLRKHYRDELDTAGAEATATVGGALFQKAIGGDTAAMIFWMKTRGGWSEKQKIDHTSSDGSMTPAPGIQEVARRLIYILESSGTGESPAIPEMTETE